MAPLSFSPEASISSHTLSAGSIQPPQMDLQNSSASLLASLLQNPVTFLQPTKLSHSSILAASKECLDSVAAAVSETQAQRQQDRRRKRKRGGYFGDEVNPLILKKVHLEGFGPGQVFEQVRKVVNAAVEDVELSLPDPEGDLLAIPESAKSELEELEDLEDELHESSIGETGVDWEYADDDALDGEEGDGEGFSENETEDGKYLDMENGESIFSDQELGEAAAEYHPDPNGLNDGFFSIDDFNRQSEFLEQQDQRGEAADSGDEAIDWDGDPFAIGPRDKQMATGGDISEHESDEGGPTFGTVDLNAPEGDSDGDDLLEDGDMNGLGDTGNANNIMYVDFFAPPAKKAGKNKEKRGRPNPHNFPSAVDPQNSKPSEDDDVERTMSRVHRDLFEDDDDVGSENDLSDLDPSDPKSRRSTHERKQAKLAEEIRKLEAANIAKRNWQLSGEARAADRPMNSLLEEDLDFERAGKPVPVITAEVSEDIESLIKRRILAGEFDEVHRRRPDDLVTGTQTRRGRFEVDDTKSGKGLAEIYEEEHLRQSDPSLVNARDEKVRKEHTEIEAMWKDISAKLNSLSSWHYKPKPAAPNLEIRVDAPAIEIEDARPTAGGEVAGASMLAPQEFYKPGDEKDEAEIVTKSGMPMAREEMTREQKLRRRRRDKERVKKQNSSKAPAKETSAQRKTKDKKELLGSLKRGGVQIIGTKGQVTDINGREVKEIAWNRAGGFKL